MFNEAYLVACTRVLYSIKDLSNECKVYWSNYVAYAFSALSQSQRLECEIKGATKVFANPQEVYLFFNQLTFNEQEWLLASLQLLNENALILEDWISHRNLTNLIKQLSTSIQVPVSGLIYSQIKTEYQAFKNRKIFKVKGSIKLVMLDFFIRLIFLWIRNVYEINPLDFIEWNFLLFIPTLGIGYWLSKVDQRYNQQLIASNDYTDYYKMRVYYSTLQYSLVGLLFVFSVTIPVFIDAEHYTSTLIGITVLGFLFYYRFLLFSVPVGRFSDNEILDQLNFEEHQAMDSDSNDEAIVLLETELNSKTGRLEAYVLESALFGALAFSGFLQIIATDLVSFADLEKFSSTFYSTFHGFFLADWNEYSKYATLLNTKVNLFCVVSIETLLCSVFFLAVIASRLKFSDVADRVRTSLNLAKAYNEKEEALLEMEMVERHQTRLEVLNRTIAMHLTNARVIMLEIKPIVSYMVYVRNAGLFTFLLVLLSSSFFITGILGFVFIAIALATLAYFNLNKMVSFFASLRLRAAVFFVSHRQVVLYVIFGILFLAFMAHVFFAMEGTGEYISFVIFLLGPYLFIWFSIMPHPDKNFDSELEMTSEVKIKRFNLNKIFYGLAILFFFFGITFKLMDWSGASKLLIIGSLLLFILNFFLMPYFTKPKWLSIPISFFVGFLFFSILFRLLLLPAATELSLFATFSLPIFFVIYFIRKKSFHILLVRLFVVLIIPTVLFSEFVIHPSLWIRAQMIYQHKTFKLNPIIETYDKVKIIRAIDDYKNTNVFDEGMKSLDWYLKTFGNTLGRTEVYSASLTALDDFISESVLNGLMKDKIYNQKIKVAPALTKMVFEAADKIIEIDSVLGSYGYSGIQIQADLYHIYHQPEKEKAFLEKMLRLEKHEIVQREVKRRLIELNAKDIR